MAAYPDHANAYPDAIYPDQDSASGPPPADRLDLTTTEDALVAWAKMRRSGRERPSVLWGSSPSLWDSH